MLAESNRLRDMTWYEFMNMPVEEYWLLSGALTTWEEARREKREAQVKLNAMDS